MFLLSHLFSTIHTLLHRDTLPTIQKLIKLLPFQVSKCKLCQIENISWYFANSSVINWYISSTIAFRSLWIRAMLKIYWKMRYSIIIVLSFTEFFDIITKLNLRLSSGIFGIFSNFPLLDTLCVGWVDDENYCPLTIGFCNWSFPSGHRLHVKARNSKRN